MSASLTKCFAILCLAGIVVANYHPHSAAPYHHEPHHQPHPQHPQHHQPHPHHPIGDKSAQFHAQDVYGNYGFGYHSHTIKGDGDYRYERKTGGHTEGGYGFSTGNGAVTMDFFNKPHSPFVPTYYDGHHPMSHIIKDIPPAPSVHIPAVPVHPLEGMPLEKGQLQAAASDIIERSSGHTPYAGPRYHSLYDITIPDTLYKLPPIPVLSNALPGALPIESDTEHHASLISHQAKLHDPLAMHAAYMSFVEKLMPLDGLHGVHMSNFNPPIKRK